MRRRTLRVTSIRQHLKSPVNRRKKAAEMASSIIIYYDELEAQYQSYFMALFR
jgi:hypothetical protein